MSLIMSHQNRLKISETQKNPDSEDCKNTDKLTKKMKKSDHMVSKRDHNFRVFLEGVKLRCKTTHPTLQFFLIILEILPIILPLSVGLLKKSLCQKTLV